MQLFLDRGKKDKLIYHQSLRNLSLNETARLIECYLKEGVYPELVEQLYQGTGGNPLLLVQLLTSLDGSQDITKLLQDPYSIITRRLSSLSPEARQILDVISILPESILDILTSLLTKDALELIYLCEHLKQYGLLSESSDSGTLEYSFAHDQIKSIVISQQTEARRRILHLRVAQYLETQQQDTTLQSYETLIYHFSAGGNRFKAFKYRILSLNLYAELCYELLPTLEAGVDSEVPAEDNMLNFLMSSSMTSQHFVLLPLNLHRTWISWRSFCSTQRADTVSIMASMKRDALYSIAFCNVKMHCMIPRC